MSSISPASVAAQKMSETQSEFATKVMRKTLDIQANQGVMLAQMINQSQGLGGSVDTYA